jgi:hypothetical protein
MGFIGTTTARLDLQEVPEDEAVIEPSPEAVPAGALKEGQPVHLSATGVLSAEAVTVATGA